MLVALMQHKDIRKAWLLDEYPSSPIVFVDTKHLFSDCPMRDDHQRKVEITHDSIYLNSKNVSYLIIKHLEVHPGKYRIIIYQSNTNALVEAEVSENGRNKMVVSKFKIGHF